MKLAISIGDLAGIGPEVVLKALRQPLGDDVDVVLFGDYRAIEEENERIGESGFTPEEFELRFARIDSESEAAPKGSVGVVDVEPSERGARVEKGRGDERCARVQRSAFQRAVAAAREERVQAVVTAPWNKSLFELLGEPVVGHTDVLDDIFPTSRPEMMLAGSRLRVSLVTTHIPLRRVPDRLTEGRIRTVVRTTVGGLRRRFGVRDPSIAVCALNPHAGEGSAMGDEEKEIIEPALDRLRGEFDENIDLEGPFPSDTLFTRFRDGATPFDAVVCMYHDQGLIPLKYQHFGESANVTLGLPIIRTSVDHGTAYDIAGEGVADAGSMRYALELACDMVRRA